MPVAARQRRAMSTVPERPPLAGRFCLSSLWGVQPGLRSDTAFSSMRRMRVSMLGDGRDHLPQDAGAAARLVLGPVPHEPRQERDFGAPTEQRDRGVLPDRLADAAENSEGH